MWRVVNRELRRLWRSPRYLILLTLGVVLTFVVFATMTGEGQPQNLPVAVVDMDGSYLSRRICHEMDATQGVRVTAVYNNHTQARRAMQRGEIFAYYEIPKGTYNELLQFRSPKLVLYTNSAYMLAGTLSYKQLATMGMLATGAVQREVMRKKGYADDEIMGLIQPVEFDTRSIGNPWIHYGNYLMTTLIPAVIAFIALMHTTYVTVREREERTFKNWMRKAGGRPLRAMVGKMLPYTFHYTLLLWIADLIMFGPMHFPMAGSWGLMMLNGALLIFAAQCAACFIAGCIPEAPLAMGVSAIYSAMSFSLSGFSFPVDSMPRLFEPLSWLYPIRHYFLNYVDIAIYGQGFGTIWPHVCALMAFGLLLVAGAAMMGWHTSRLQGFETQGLRVSETSRIQDSTQRLSPFTSKLNDIWIVFSTEVRRVFSDRMVLLIFFIAPLLYPLIFCYMYSNESVVDMPVAVVDESGCEASRRLAHKLDATPELTVAWRTGSLGEAQQLLRDHKVRGVFYVPADFADRLARRQTARVVVFADMSSFYYYKAVLGGGNAVLIDEMHTIELERYEASGLGRDDAASQMLPVSVEAVTAFNPGGGYGSFFLPALLMLVIHQTLFLGICILCGEANENSRSLRLIPPRLRNGRSVGRVIAGRSLCYLLIYVPICLLDLWLMPRWFNLPQIGNPYTIAAFLLPLLLSVIFFATTIGNIFVRQKISPMLCFVFFSLVLFFLTGMVWPQQSMPAFWQVFSHLFPSTPGVQGFVKISSMGASLAQVRHEYLILWTQAGVYFTTACLSVRFIKRYK